MVLESKQKLNRPPLDQADFLWGSATSAYQVEGGNIWSDWAEWEKNNHREECGQAVRHYEKFREDFIWAKTLGQNAHRFSLEWARIEPQPGNFSSVAFEHYRRVIETLRQLKIKIFLTLHHFTLPGWLAKQGGWENPQSVKYFQRYVSKVVEELGSEVDFWLTINEPLVLASEGYLYGHWPPQVKSRRRFKMVINNLSEAHRLIYQFIHQAFPQAQVGWAHNFFSLEPRRRWWGDKWATRQADHFWNQWIFNLTAGHHDFLGVNYYFHQRVYLSLNFRRGFVSFADPRKLGLEVSALGWEINPRGLYQVLSSLWERYHLPLYVTENGIAPISESQRENFIRQSIAALRQAKAKGVDVRGYFYWSLLDNFEWDKGFTPKFGLLAVDRKTWQRRPRSAAQLYALFCRGQI